MATIDAYNPDQDQEFIPAVPVDTPIASSPAVAEDRAKRANFGLQGKVKETYPDYYQSMLNGKEDQLRDSVAAQIGYENVRKRNQAISYVASRIGRPLVPDDLNTIDRKLAGEPDSPSSVFEDHFAKQYMSYLNWPQSKPDNTTWLKTAQTEHPEEFNAYQRVGENLIATRELVNNRLQNVAQNVHDESWWQTIKDVGKMMVPGYQNYQLSNLVDQVGTSLALGNNLEDQSQKFYGMSRQDQASTLDRIHEQLKDNPHLEAAYLTALVGQSTNDKFINNFMLPVDIATVPFGTTAIKGAARAVFPQLAMKNTIAGLAKSIGKEAAEIAAPAAAGDLETAAIRRAAGDIASDSMGNDPRDQVIRGMNSFLQGKVEKIGENPGNFGAELSNQLKENVENLGTVTQDVLANRMRISRTPYLRTLEGVLKEHFQTYIETYFPSLDNKIADVKLIDEPLTNTAHLELHLVNQKGVYFQDAEAAKYYANKIHTLKDFTIEGNPATFEDIVARLDEPVTAPAQKTKTPMTYAAVGDRGPIVPASAVDSGSGYYIKIIVPWNENSKFAYQMIQKAIETNSYGAKTPTSLLNRFIGGLRTPEDTMAQMASINRGIATFGPNVLNKVVIAAGQDLQNLTKGAFPFTAQRQKWNEFKRIVDSGRKITDRDTGKLGYTFKNPGELEYQYQKVLQRLPDEQEIRAYFAWKGLNELDYTLRNLSVLRNMYRQGAMKTIILSKDAEGNEVRSDHFPGIHLGDQIPSGDHKVLIMGNTAGESQILSLRALGKDTEMGTILRTGKTKGGQFTSKPQIVQLYDDLSRPLKGFGPVKDERIRYVVGNFERKNLDFKQLPETGGGHFIYEYPFYLKQAILGRDGTKVNYEGDNTLWAIRTRAEGRELEKRLNGFRELIRDSKFAEAKAFLRANPVGYDYQDVYEMFKPDKNIKPRIDPDEPIRLMDNNKNIGDAFGSEYKAKYGKDFSNSYTTGNPASQYQIAFTGERDVRELMTIMDRGGKGNPIFNVEPAQLLDPMTTMNRSLNNISNSFYFDDLKLTFMQHWLQEAKPYLAPKQQKIIDRAGFSIFHDPDFNEAGRNADQLDRIRQLELTRQQHLALVTRPSQQESYLTSAAQKLSDAMYKNLGPDYVIKPLSFLSMTRDGPGFLRQIAFHFKLGMFNPSEFLKQMNTWAVIMGVEGPGRAGSGAAAAYMYHLTAINRSPEVMKSMGRLLENFGWRPGEYEEWASLVENSGFGTVAGEHASRDNIWSGSVYSNGGQRFLSLGASFFTEGDRNVRYGAMATAYRRFRDVNPTGALSAANKEEIFQRARLLNVNMDRGSNSLFQHGLASIPLQFQSYYMRLAEMMFSKRLTTMEKTRLFATMSTLYGLPIGTTLWGFPIADHIRKLATEQGYQVGDGYIKDTVMNGVPAALINMATNHTYNIGQTYGPTGIASNLFDNLHSDATMWSIILGAATGPTGSVFADTWANTDSIRRWAMNMYTDGYKTNWEDVVQSFKAITSVNRGDQTRMALQTGNWYSRKGTLLDTDIRPMDAITMLLTGLDHQQVSDGYLMGNQTKNREEYNKHTEELFIERFRKGIMAAQAGVGYNPDQADSYFQDAANLLRMRDFPMLDIPSLKAKALDRHESLVKSIPREYNLKHVPAGQEEELRQRQIRSRELGGNI